MVQRTLIPFVNYVPVDINLNDLKSTIELLIKNDELAKRIAINARSFDNAVFNPTYQREYIESQIRGDKMPPIDVLYI
ncbi:MAG TPA: hypothetical protein VLG50_08080 [Candidatus Saccharimonadales bacterium]|nr:hypothetical protein [Candidatus Saccharimonadales bacterium]